MTIDVRPSAIRGPEAAADRSFVSSLGRRSAMASVGTLRRAPEREVAIAFERLYEIVEAQSHVTLIASEDGARVGFLMLLDRLPDEVTLTDQAFVAYMAVEPEARNRGVGAALLVAAEDEAKRRGLPYMALMVTEDNGVARRLYERAGYRDERRLMCKPL